jgi:ArsR family transcriptional regulator
MAPDTVSHRQDSAVDVTRDELERRLLDPGLTLVDVLPRESFESGHLPGAISLPLSEVDARAREVLPDRSREIIVYCGGPT